MWMYPLWSVYIATLQPFMITVSASPSDVASVDSSLAGFDIGICDSSVMESGTISCVASTISLSVSGIIHDFFLSFVTVL